MMGQPGMMGQGGMMGQPGMMDLTTMAMMQQQQQQQQMMGMNPMYPQTPGAGMMPGVGGFMNPMMMQEQQQQQQPFMSGGEMMPGSYDYFGAAANQYDPYGAYAQQMPGYGAGMYTPGMGPMSIYDPDLYGRRFLPERNYFSSVKDL
ncbi:hypothetical protein INT45_010570 [Circinella minor]|uniref:Uncharacterized protein n=1 Tax=Circinella minor TaxID=1195481 RepID=A0A8H7S6I9_9FUNG|nr:hypothetical protein INT45_010570 [Circinella minor]